MLFFVLNTTVFLCDISVIKKSGARETLKRVCLSSISELYLWCANFKWTQLDFTFHLLFFVMNCEIKLIFNVKRVCISLPLSQWMNSFTKQEWYFGILIRLWMVHGHSKHFVINQLQIYVNEFTILARNKFYYMAQ